MKVTISAEISPEALATKTCDAVSGIATNILIDRLKHLEAEGILHKARDPENRRSYLYSFTPKGWDLMPVILEIIIWSGLHDQRDFAKRETLEKIRNDREAFETSLLAKQ